MHFEGTEYFSNIYSFHIIQVWRGYHGNVYFEPIKVVTAPIQASPVTPQPQQDNCSEPLGKLLTKRAHTRFSCRSTTKSTSSLNGYSDVRMRSALSESVPPKSNLYSNISTSMKRTSKSAPSPSTRKMAILDKRSVFHKHNSYIHEDVEWILAQESTGSLCIVPPKRGHSDPRLRWNRERICRGSVAHKIFANKNGNNPLLSVERNIKPCKSGVNKTYQKPPREFLQDQLPALHNCKSADSYKNDFHHVIPTLERMNLDERQGQPSNIPLQ